MSEVRSGEHVVSDARLSELIEIQRAYALNPCRPGEALALERDIEAALRELEQLRATVASMNTGAVQEVSPCTYTVHRDGLRVTHELGCIAPREQLGGASRWYRSCSCGALKRAFPEAYEAFGE